MHEINCIVARVMISFRTAWSLHSFTWAMKVQFNLFHTHQCIHSSVSFHRFQRKLLQSLSHLIACSLHPAKLLSSFAFPFSHCPWRGRVAFTGAASGVSFPAARRKISNLPSSRAVQIQLLKSWCLGWTKWRGVAAQGCSAVWLQEA